MIDMQNLRFTFTVRKTYYELKASKFSFGFQINLCLTFNALYLTGIGHLTLGLNLVVSRAR